MLENVTNKLSRAKAKGLDDITTEHLQYCHHLLPLVLVMLFNLMMRFGGVIDSFCRSYSYTVQILKDTSAAYGRRVDVNNFRGISISPVISNVFEHRILHRYGTFLSVATINLTLKRVQPVLMQYALL